MKGRLEHLSRACLIALAAALVAAFGLDARAAEFLIGEHAALSGAYAKPGTLYHQGIVLAVKEYNRRQKTHTAKLVTIDDQSDPAKAVAAVEELLAKGVVAFAGGFGSNVCGPASEAAIRAGGVYVTAGGSSPALTERGYDRYFTYVTSTGPAAPWISLLPSLGIRKVSMLVLKREGTQGIATAAEEGLRKQGLEVLVNEFDPGVEDFKPLVNAVKVKDRPEAILVAAYEKENLAIMRAVQVVHPDVKLIGGTNGWSHEQLVLKQAPLLAGTLGGGYMSYPPQFGSDEERRFFDSYKEQFGGKPDGLVQWNYDVGLTLLEAMEKAHAAGKLDGATIARFVRNEGKPRPGLSGASTFDAKGNNTSFAYRIVQYVPGGLALVWPPELAKAKVKLPARPW